MTALTCPFCNTPFDLPEIPGRVVCPRCGEAIPAKLLPAVVDNPIAISSRPGPLETAPGEPTRRSYFMVALALICVVSAGSGIWYYSTMKTADTVSTDRAPPAATWPPATLKGLRHLPPDSQIVMALQVSPIVQYGQRNGKPPGAVLADMGLPAEVFAGLRKAGVLLEQIDHIIMGVGFSESPLPKLSVVLFLKQPVYSERQFREVLKFRQNADKLGRATVDIPGLFLPMGMHTIDETTYLFSSDDKTLDRMAGPDPEFDHKKSFGKGLQMSLDSLQLASCAWIITDDLDWANLPILKLAAPLLKQPDLPKRLKGIRSLAIGWMPDQMAGGPLMTMNGVVRFADAKMATEFVARAEPKFDKDNLSIASEREAVRVQAKASFLVEVMPNIIEIFDR